MLHLARWDSSLVSRLGVRPWMVPVVVLIAGTSGCGGCGRDKKPVVTETTAIVVPEEKKSKESTATTVPPGERGPDPVAELVRTGDRAATAELARIVADDTTALARKGAALAALRGLEPELLDEALWAALQSGKKEVRVWAAEELGKQTGDAVVESLVKALSDPDPDVRTAAANALGRQGPRASKAAPVLEKRSKDDKAPEGEKAATRDALAQVNSRATLASRAASDANALEREWSGDGDALNLFRLPTTKLASTTAAGAEAAGLVALTDHDPATTATATAAPDAPLVVVFGFDGATVTAERLLVRLPRHDHPGASTGRVEVLFSTLSPHAGFKSARAAPLVPVGQTQEVVFTPTAAKWVMVRFAPAEGLARVAVAEVGLLGRVGPPRTRYPFKVAPARALDVLAKMEHLSAAGPDRALTAEEKDLLADVAEGQFRKWSLAEAALLASGVRDRERRQAYLAAIAEIEAKVKTEVAGEKTPFEKGAKLLAWLHAHPCSKGYVAGRTNLSDLLDSKSFNCVSSATLYMVLANKLGLDVRAVEVPDHVFPIVYDGANHADVETTTAQGFNPARDRAAVAARLMRETGLAYIPESHPQKRRETGPAGLVAMIYNNRGSEFAREKRFPEAVHAYIRALSLDPELAAGVVNVLHTLAGWGAHLALEGKYEDALQVLAVGVELAPQDAGLQHTHRAAWAAHAEAAIAAGKDADALAILKRAAEAIPAEAEQFARMRAWVQIRRGEEQLAAGKWEESVGRVQQTLGELDGPAREEFRGWAVTVFLRWARSELDMGRFPEAAGAIEKGIAAHLESKHMAHYLAYVVQEWALKEGGDKAEALLADKLKRYTNVPEVNRAATGYVLAGVTLLLRDGHYPEAIAFVERCDGKGLLKDKVSGRDVIMAVFVQWADALAAKGDWAGATERYTTALAKNPKHKGLLNNALATWDSWAKTFIEKADWAGAVEVYRKAKKQFPESDHVRGNLGYVVRRWVKDVTVREGAEPAAKLLAKLKEEFPDLPGERAVAAVVAELTKAGRYQEVVAFLDRDTEGAAEREAVKDLYFAAYNAWSQEQRGHKNWGRAIAVYESAHHRFPKDGRYKSGIIDILKEAAADAGSLDGEAKARLMLQSVGRSIPDLTKDLTGSLTSGDPKVRVGSAEVLRKLGATAAVPALVDRVADGVWFIRKYTDEKSDPVGGGKAAALDALRALAPAEEAGALARAARSDTPEVKVWAIGELAKLEGAGQKPAVVESLTAALTAKDGDKHRTGGLALEGKHPRRVAAEALKKLGVKGSAKALADRVADDRWYDDYGNVPNDPVGGGKAAALDALRSLAPAEVIGALVRGAQSKRPEVRVWAIGELGGLDGAGKDPAVVAVIAAAVADDDAHRGQDKVIKDKAVILNALRSLAPDQVAAALVKAVRSNNPYVRVWAIDELAGLDNASMDPTIIEAIAAALALKDPDRDLTSDLAEKKRHPRTVAAEALKKLGAKSAAQALVDRVADDFWYDSGYSNRPKDPVGGGKAAALDALRSLAPERVIPALKEAGKSKNDHVRKWAEEELGAAERKKK